MLAKLSTVNCGLERRFHELFHVIPNNGAFSDKCKTSLWNKQSRQSSTLAAESAELKFDIF